MPTYLNNNKKNIHYSLMTLVAFILWSLSNLSTANGLNDENKFSKNNHVLNAEPALKIASTNDAINKAISKPIKWNIWQANPYDSEEYFVGNNQGQIYIIKSGVPAKQPFLDLNIGLSLAVKQHITLTAFILHPNFSIRDQAGYLTLYTAHSEKFNNKHKSNRLQESNAVAMLTHDVVITEWQVSAGDKKSIDLTTKREVLRIATPNAESTITQLGFHQYKKTWNNDFGLLYIALSSANNASNLPLYSGVILRINPEKFALRSFTIPASNPFLKNADIHDAIYLLGAQQLTQFIWPDKSSEQLLIAHQYNNQQLLSLSNGKSDWRNSSPKQILYKNDVPLSKISLYQGRTLSNLLNKVLILGKESNSWQLYSLTKNSPPQQEWQLSAQQFPTAHDVIMFHDHRGEMVLLNTSDAKTYNIIEGLTPNINAPSRSENQSNILAASANSSENDEAQPNEDSNATLISLIFIIFAGGAFFILKIKNSSARTLLQKHFIHIEASESNLQLGLYRYHQTSPEVILNIADVTMCDVQLNDINIQTINTSAENGFNASMEHDLRKIFSKEKIKKLINQQMRAIHFVVTDKKHQQYKVCLYLRRGNNRITKHGYGNVIDDLVDWCWLIAKTINAENTDARQVLTKPANANINNDVSKTLHNQIDVTNLSKSHHIKQGKTPRLNASITDNNSDSNTMSTPSVTPNKATETSDSLSRATDKHDMLIDTELVNALEKLVKLKQDGFLTGSEFEQAKAKLLKNLFEK